MCVRQPLNTEAMLLVDLSIAWTLSCPSLSTRLLLNRSPSHLTPTSPSTSPHSFILSPCPFPCSSFTSSFTSFTHVFISTPKAEASSPTRLKLICPFSPLISLLHTDHSCFQLDVRGQADHCLPLKMPQEASPTCLRCLKLSQTEGCGTV